MTTVRFLELAAATAAVSHRRVGATRISPYMGSKKLLADRLIELMGLAEVSIDTMVWVDVGEWGRTLDVVHHRAEEVAATLSDWCHMRFAAQQRGEDVRYWTDDAELFRYLRTTRPPDDDPVLRAATHVFLQTRSYNGKPVSATPTGWKTHGFDPEYRDTKISVAAKPNNRGWASPRWTLAERIRANAALSWPKVDVHQADIRVFLQAEDAITSRDIVYFDPNYRGVTGYPDMLSREDVVDIGRNLRGRARATYISEAEPIAELVAEGWNATALAHVGEGKRRWKASTCKEWVTWTTT